MGDAYTINHVPSLLTPREYISALLDEIQEKGAEILKLEAKVEKLQRKVKKLKENK